VNQTVGGLYGQGNTAIGKPQSEADAAAQRWAQCRERLDRARAAYSDAQAEVNAAIDAEQEAWTILENTSGRGVPTAPSAPAVQFSTGRR
jgi:multidrug resistance efflux pump